MAKKKLFFSEDDITEIEKFRKYLATIEVNETEMSKIHAGGCSEQCMITCAHYCQGNCELTCSETCTETCSGIFLNSKEGCYYCGTFMNFMVFDQ